MEQTEKKKKPSRTTFSKTGHSWHTRSPTTTLPTRLQSMAWAGSGRRRTARDMHGSTTPKTQDSAPSHLPSRFHKGQGQGHGGPRCRRCFCAPLSTTCCPPSVGLHAPGSSRNSVARVGASSRLALGLQPETGGMAWCRLVHGVSEWTLHYFLHPSLFTRQLL